MSIQKSINSITSSFAAVGLAARGAQELSSSAQQRKEEKRQTEKYKGLAFEKYNQVYQGIGDEKSKARFQANLGKSQDIVNKYAALMKDQALSTDALENKYKSEGNVEGAKAVRAMGLQRKSENLSQLEKELYGLTLPDRVENAAQASVNDAQMHKSLGKANLKARKESLLITDVNKWGGK